MGESHRAQSWPYTAVSRREDLFGVPVDALNRAESLDALTSMLDDGFPHLVVTPNSDHFMRWQADSTFRSYYDLASLSIVDGAPLVWMARLMGQHTLQRFPGVDLFIALLDAQERPDLRVFVVGSSPSTCEKAAKRLKIDFSRARLVGHDSPSPTDLEDSAYLRTLVSKLEACQPNVVVLALGSPKQEALYARLASSLPPACYMGLGATIDFLAGELPRAPRIMQCLGFEWLYRLAREPRRLAKRYLITDTPIVFFLARALIYRIQIRRTGR